MEQDISRLVEKLAEVPNIQSTTAVLVDEGQIKKQKGNIPFRWIYLDQLLGRKLISFVISVWIDMKLLSLQVKHRRKYQPNVEMSTQNGRIDKIMECRGYLEIHTDSTVTPCTFS